MNFYCIKCSKFTENNNLKVKRKIDDQISFYAC